MTKSIEREEYEALQAELKRLAGEFLAAQKTSERVHREEYDAVVAERDTLRDWYKTDIPAWRVKAEAAKERVKELEEKAALVDYQPMAGQGVKRVSDGKMFLWARELLAALTSQEAGQE